MFYATTPVGNRYLKVPARPPRTRQAVLRTAPRSGPRMRCEGAAVPPAGDSGRGSKLRWRNWLDVLRATCTRLVRAPTSPVAIASCKAGTAVGARDRTAHVAAAAA